MNINRRSWLSLLICAVAMLAHAAGANEKDGPEWLTDLPKAMTKAKEENKLVMLDFTGSDWCPPCIRLKKEVFLKPEFAEYANKNLILVEVDFPRRKKLPEAQRKANEALSEKYDIEGFPTVVVLNKEGKLVGKPEYEGGGAKAFVALLEKLAKH